MFSMKKLFYLAVDTDVEVAENKEESAETVEAHVDEAAFGVEPSCNCAYEVRQQGNQLKFDHFISEAFNK